MGSCCDLIGLSRSAENFHLLRKPSKNLFWNKFSPFAAPRVCMAAGSFYIPLVSLHCPDRLTTLVGRKYCITYVNPLFITASTALIRTHFTSLRTDGNSLTEHRRLTITGSKKVLNYFPLVYIFRVFPRFLLFFVVVVSL